MGKDPAFLFYSSDFIAATQHMSCEEVGAFVRLLCHQHQHSSIPTDEEKLMRITGIFTTEKWREIWQEVRIKFNQMVDQNGNQMVGRMVNQELEQVVNERANHKPKKIAAATLAGLLSSRKELTYQHREKIKKSFRVLDFIALDENLMKEKIKEWFNQMVNHLVNNIEDRDGNGNGIENKDKNKKGGVGENKELIWPFPSEKFKAKWAEWKTYKKEVKKKTYKTLQSEQYALKDLQKKSDEKEAVAIEMLEYAMAQTWTTFYPLQTHKKNGKPNKSFNSKTTSTAADLRQQQHNQTEKLFGAYEGYVSKNFRSE